MNIEKEVSEYLDKVLGSEFKYEKAKVTNDWLGKERVAKGIVGDFERRVGSVDGKSILDFGFGAGITLGAFAEAGANMFGAEVVDELYDIAVRYLDEKKISANLKLFDGKDLPFKDESFDYIYSISVIEHVTYPVKFLQDAYRTLKPGGKFYLAFPNRFYPKETHTGVWFASWLPRGLAEKYLRLFGRSSINDYWNLHFRSYFWLKKLLKNNKIGFKVIYEPEGIGLKGCLKRFMAKIGVHHSAILPHVMIVLEKP